MCKKMTGCCINVITQEKMHQKIFLLGNYNDENIINTKNTN